MVIKLFVAELMRVDVNNAFLGVVAVVVELDSFLDPRLLRDWYRLPLSGI